MSAIDRFEWVPVTAVGEIAGRDAATGWRWAKHGRLGDIRYTGKRAHVRREALERLLGRTLGDQEIAAAIERAATKVRERTRRERRYSHADLELTVRNNLQIRDQQWCVHLRRISAATLFIPKLPVEGSDA